MQCAYFPDDVQLSLELADISFADAAGITLLRELRSHGVDLIRTTPFLPSNSKMGLDLSNSRATKECMPKSEEPPSRDLGSPRTVGGFSMLEQAVCRERSWPAGSLQGVQRNIPFPELQSDVSRTVALICHDLRLPLTAILANAEFLTESDISETERNEFYQEIRWSVDRINELVTSLLECSKGYDTFRPAVRNIVGIVERAIRMISVIKEFRHIMIKHHHQSLAVGWFDSNRLERVVANLVLNACEAVSPDSGRIVITTTGNQAGLQIAVWDNGPGIPTAIKNSIFLPFVSYERPRTAAWVSR